MKRIYILITVLFAAIQICLAQTNKRSFHFERVDGNTTQQNTVKTTVTPSTGKTATAVKSKTSTKSSSGRLVLGGTLGMSFGDYTNINISPQLGYMVNSLVTLGGGLSYSYYGQKSSDYTRNYLGANLYARLYPVQYLTLYAQPEVHRSWGKTGGLADVENVFPCLLLGGGLVIPSWNGGVSLTFYYDVLQNRASPYGNKIGYSVGYTFVL